MKFKYFNRLDDRFSAVNICVLTRGQHYVPRYLCSPIPMFPGTYVPRYRCSPNLCSPVPNFKKAHSSSYSVPEGHTHIFFQMDPCISQCRKKYTWLTLRWAIWVNYSHGPIIINNNCQCMLGIMLGRHVTKNKLLAGECPVGDSWQSSSLNDVAFSGNGW